LCSTFACDLSMPTFTSGKLITILHLPEIFILDLCLVLNVNA
jgi:hypothetical protein